MTSNRNTLSEMYFDRLIKTDPSNTVTHKFEFEGSRKLN